MTKKSSKRTIDDLTMEDFFACVAMHALMKESYLTPDKRAKFAYEQAREMLTEREANDD